MRGCGPCRAGAAVRRAVVPVLLAAALLTGCGGTKPAQAVPHCEAGGLTLTLEQTANAATIAVVGKRLALPDHAITVALATALQESGLRNLAYGDRDSLGLFQQRPSQGWGPPATIRTPRLSAANFYRRLIRIPGWAALPVTEAAQRVQRSGDAGAYAQWETTARILAVALTGEVPAGLACAYRPAAHPVIGPGLSQSAALELCAGGLTRSGAVRSWTAATWLVAQASAFGVSAVSVNGRTWTPGSGAWRPDARAGTALTYR